MMMQELALFLCTVLVLDNTVIATNHKQNGEGDFTQTQYPYPSQTVEHC